MSSSSAQLTRAIPSVKSPPDGDDVHKTSLKDTKILKNGNSLKVSEKDNDS